MSSFRRPSAIAACWLGFALTAAAATNLYYVVSANPSEAYPFDTWAAAATDIQAAVDAAQSAYVPGTTDCVVLVSNGTYTLTSPIQVNKGITLRSVNGSESVILNGNAPFTTNRCMAIAGAAGRVTVDGFTVSNGFAHPEPIGGGLYVTNSQAAILNCVFVRNRAGLGAVNAAGGGLGVVRSPGILVTNCLFLYNTNVAAVSASPSGAACFFSSRGLMSDCTMISNVCVNYGQGGGVAVDGTGMNASDMVVSNCVMIFNSANYGGGVYVAGGTLIGCFVSNNSARTAGGGVTLFNSYDNDVANCLITCNRSLNSGGISINRGNLFNCVITKNYATGSGGGLYNSEGVVRNCLFAGNRADISGGGVCWPAQTRQLINCTFTRNSAGVSGGGLFIGVANASVTNLIVFGNQAGVSNDVAGFAGAPSFSCSPAFTAGGASSNITSDPLFVDNGSDYGTNAVLGDYRLQTNSPCIGLGKNLSWMTVDPVLDVEGNGRIRPSWGRVDMGAYEAYPQAGLLTNSFVFAPATGAAPLQVSFAAETSGSTNGLLYRWFFGDGESLAWSPTGSLIHVYSARTNAYTVTLGVSNALGESASRTFTNAIMAYPSIVYVATNGAHVPPFESWAHAATNLQSAVDVAGGGISTVLVGSGTYRVGSPVAVGKSLLVTSQNGAGDTVIAGRWPQSTNRCFTITAAGAILEGLTITNGCARDVEGGGVLMTGAGIIRNCVFAGNRSEGSSASGGGAVSFSAGSVIGCLFRNNTAAAYNGGAVIMSGASSLLSNCVVIGNTANGAGGGIQQASGLITHCVITQNTCGTAGGGLYKTTSASGTAQNCLIALNRAGTSAGGVYAGGTGGILFQNCTVADNAATNWAGGIELLAGTVRNCIVDGNTSPRQGQENATLSGGSFVTNLVAPLMAGNLSGEPCFADRAGGDYRIRAGSPAIDAADAASAVITDLNGLDRPRDGNGDGFAAPDLGAYESPGTASGALRCSIAASAWEAFDAVTIGFTAVAEGADTNGLAYFWSFGDGTTSDWSAATRTPSHAYGIGTFPVALAVSNAAGQSASWSSSVRVLPSAVYVDSNGSHQWPYTSWGTAATNLQSAVDAAGSTATTGSWIWVASGTYTVRQPLVILEHVTLKGLVGAAGTVVHGNYPATSNRCLTMNASGATVDGLTLTGGFAADASGAGSIGGGAYVKAGTIRNCDVRFNQAYNGGGGVYMEMASLLDSTVYGNLGSKVNNSPAGPGGVYYNGLAGYESVISNCWIACNTNNNTGGGIGETYGLVSNCRIERNVTLLNNTGTGGGGARINYTTLENCEVVSNSSASVGGGVQVYQYGILRGCLVAANEARGIGGGVNLPSNTGARQKIENCTIVGNSATNGGGVYCVVALASGTNCIVTGNRATMPGGTNDIGGTFANFAYSCSPSLQNGLSNNITAAPLFARSGSGYGLAHAMGNYRLKSGSPGIDAGAVLPWMSGALDLDGTPRIQGTAPNMGAYEKVAGVPGVLFMIR